MCRDHAVSVGIYLQRNCIKVILVSANILQHSYSCLKCTTSNCVAFEALFLQFANTQ